MQLKTILNRVEKAKGLRIFRGTLGSACDIKAEPTKEAGTFHRTVGSRAFARMQSGQHLEGTRFDCCPHSTSAGRFIVEFADGITFVRMQQLEHAYAGNPACSPPSRYHHQKLQLECYCPPSLPRDRYPLPC